MGAAIQASALAGAERRKSAIPPPPAPARRASTQPGVGRGTQPTGSTRPPDAGVGRLRLSSMLDAGETPAGSPETKPFEPRRPQPTRPGLQPPGPPPGAAPAEGGKASTLLGLGARARTKTGAGLGPEAASARGDAPRAAPPPVPQPPPWVPPAKTLLSAEREAASALDEITHRVLETAEEEAPPTTPSSVPTAPSRSP